MKTNCHRKFTTLAVLCLIPAVSARADDSDFAKQKSDAGAVFVMSNHAADNEVLAFRRAEDGELTRTGSYSTHGSGQGVDFDTQGGLTLSENHRYLYACNPGSDTVALFEVNGSKLKFIERVRAGDQPLSITLHGNLAYVLDGSVAGNGITGFTVGSDGCLTPIPKSFRALSSPIAVPGEVQFSPDGKFLVVTHKVGSALDVFPVGAKGLAGMPVAYMSAGPRPFAVAFKDDGNLLVVESGLPTMANAAVSSYAMDNMTGALSDITLSAKNAQTDGCWIVITNNQKYAYTANFINGSISSYRLAADGSVTLIDGAAGSTGPKSNVTDLGFSSDSRYLYNLLRGTGEVAGYRVHKDGSLTKLGVYNGCNVLKKDNGPSGLAAY